MKSNRKNNINNRVIKNASGKIVGRLSRKGNFIKQGNTKPKKIPVNMEPAKNVEPKAATKVVVRYRGRKTNARIPNLNATLMTSTYRNSIINYFRALCDPEATKINGWDVKLPSPIDLPTKTIHIENSWAITPNAQGKFLISWRPNYLFTRPAQEKFVERVKERMNELADASTEIPSLVHVTNMYTTGNKWNLVSQITLNNSETLNGEGPNANSKNIFLPMKDVDLKVLKYRLVSAKLKLQYDGRDDDESGSITSGQYVGNIQPMAAFSPTYSGYYIPSQGQYQDIVGGTTSTFEVTDESNNMKQFEQFDNISALNYAQTHPLRKDSTYSWIYYPFDLSTEPFSAIGHINEEDDWWMANALHEWTVSSDEKVLGNMVAYKIFQRDQKFKSINDYAQIYPTPTQHCTVETQNKQVYIPHRTVPSYIISGSNISKTTSEGYSNLKLTLYENYEVIVDQDLNLLGNGENEKPKIDKKQYEEILNMAKNMILNNVRIKMDNMTTNDLPPYARKIMNKIRNDMYRQSKLYSQFNTIYA